MPDISTITTNALTGSRKWGRKSSLNFASLLVLASCGRGEPPTAQQKSKASVPQPTKGQGSSRLTDQNLSGFQNIELRQPTEVIETLFRQLNFCQIPCSGENPNDVLDVFWSQSCDDTIRLYQNTLRPMFEKPLVKPLLVSLHLIPRSAADIDMCLKIRSVRQDKYFQLIKDILSLGAETMFAAPPDAIEKLIARNEGLGDSSYNLGFSYNCLIAQHQYATTKLGVNSTPTMFMNGIRISEQSLRKISI